MNDSTFEVTGMTCSHCVAAVTSELSALPGVTAVSVQLDPTGVSTLTLTSTELPDPIAVSAALDEAGNYQLV